MRRYADKTRVPEAQSRAEIEHVLARYGATGFAYANSGTRARVEFLASGRRVRFDVVLPDAKDFKNDERRAAEIRRLWRALLLGIKAKLEVVASGLAIFEEEFLAHVVMPDDQTVASHVLPAVHQAYASGKVRALLPEFTE